MPNFSTILQSPEVRAIVQENLLERAFHDALFPRLMFRSEANPVAWPANVGDTMVFTGVGLITPKMTPLVPGQDPLPSTYTSEQWTAQLQQYADTMDTHMPSSMVAIANLFLRNAQQLGMSAAQSLNRIPRNKMYNAALSGMTVADGAQASVTTVRVKRLNGLTRSRRPDLTSGSAVRFDFVSANNPLAVSIYNTSGTTAQAVNIVGFTADTSGDETGPGTITVDSAVTVSDRDYVITSDSTSIVRVGGAKKVDGITGSNVLTLAAIRSAVARFWSMNVPEMSDGRFHCHMDPVSLSQIFGDSEFQRLLRGLPDYYMYKDFAVGELLGCVFFRDNECPLPETVVGGTSGAFSQQDPFAGELFSTGITTGTRIHRPLFLGQGLINEYYQDLDGLVTEAGVQGKLAEPRISNNGIEVFSERIQLVIRAPQNRLQDQVSTSWKFIGDWPARTDVTTGDGARYKRAVVVEHGE